MKHILFLAYRISRPRFWTYLAGPFVIGYTAGVSKQIDLLSMPFFLQLLYFLIPANVLLYGINDLFDMDTDAKNKKKEIQENRLKKDEKKILQIIVGISFFVSLIFLMAQKNSMDTSIFCLFLVLSIVYSTPPIRFKARPFLDFSSNILYALPGFLAYHQITNTVPPLTIIIAAFCWTGAMHLFSAIPDITADKAAGITTTAVYLEKKGALLLCSLLWSIAFILIFSKLFPWSCLAVIYPLIPLLVLTKKTELIGVYWKFPYITAALGMLLFLIIFLAKPYA